MTILTGKENLTEHSIEGDSGYPVKRAFCKSCGARICGWCTNPDASAMFDGVGSLTIGIGTLDIPTEEMDRWKKGGKWFKEQKVLVNVD